MNIKNIFIYMKTYQNNVRVNDSVMTLIKFAYSNSLPNLGSFYFANMGKKSLD